MKVTMNEYNENGKSLKKTKIEIRYCDSKEGRLFEIMIPSGKNKIAVYVPLSTVISLVVDRLK